MIHLMTVCMRNSIANHYMRVERGRMLSIHHRLIHKGDQDSEGQRAGHRDRETEELMRERNDFRQVHLSR